MSVYIDLSRDCRRPKCATLIVPEKSHEDARSQMHMQSDVPTLRNQNSARAFWCCRA